MDHGKLEEVSTPSALIESLGAYAVDEMTADGTQNHYFHTRQEAIRYLEELTGQASLRETTLEDCLCRKSREAFDFKIADINRIREVPCTGCEKQQTIIVMESSW